MDNNIVDMKKTQIELLKLLKKINNNNNLDESYEDIFIDITKISNILLKLKDTSLLNMKLLEKADLITKKINEKYEEPIEITYTNLKLHPPIKLKSMDFDDSLLILKETDYESHYKKLHNYIDEKEALITVSEDTTSLESILNNINETINTIDLLCIKLKEPLNKETIKKNTNSVNFSEDYFGKELIEISSSDIEPPSESSKNIFNGNTIKINDNEVTLDDNPQFGGNLDTYIKLSLNKYNKKTKIEFITEIKIKIKELENKINEFNILYIQYNYYQLFIIKKIKYLINLPKHNIFLNISVGTIKKYYNKIEPLFEIISNKTEIFSNDKNKIYYFKHYYIITILYYFFKYINEKVIDINDSFIINYEESCNMYIILFNLYYDKLN